MRINIRSVENGFILSKRADRSESNLDADTTLYQETDTPDENLKRMLCDLVDCLEESGNGGRYAESKLMLISIPGDKFEGILSKGMRDNLLDLKQRIDMRLTNFCGMEKEDCPDCFNG